MTTTIRHDDLIGSIAATVPYRLMTAVHRETAPPIARCVLPTDKADPASFLQLRRAGAKRFITSFSFLLMLGVLLSATSAGATEGTAKLTRRAEQLASRGLAMTLKTCTLPRTCGGTAPWRHTKIKRQTGNDLDVDQRTLYFPGLVIELWYELDYNDPHRAKPVHPYRHPLILQMTVTDKRWPVEYGLHVGVSRAEVYRKLGAQGTHQACARYGNEKEQDEIVFCFENDRVRQIQWTPWND